MNDTRFTRSKGRPSLIGDRDMAAIGFGISPDGEFAFAVQKLLGKIEPGAVIKGLVRTSVGGVQVVPITLVPIEAEDDS